ncbi:hypothetical protein C8R44DRAFT_849560 [Mycena epipterygia]|nr:hypothetical protein C8R44DRAFT_849560 [Mycena epipterygia]
MAPGFVIRKKRSIIFLDSDTTTGRITSIEALSLVDHDRKVSATGSSVVTVVKEKRPIKLVMFTLTNKLPLAVSTTHKVADAPRDSKIIKSLQSFWISNGFRWTGMSGFWNLKNDESSTSNYTALHLMTVMPTGTQLVLPRTNSGIPPMLIGKANAMDEIEALAVISVSSGRSQGSPSPLPGVTVFKTPRRNWRALAMIRKLADMHSEGRQAGSHKESRSTMVLILRLNIGWLWLSGLMTPEGVGSGEWGGVGQERCLSIDEPLGFYLLETTPGPRNRQCFCEIPGPGPMAPEMNLPLGSLHHMENCSWDDESAVKIRGPLLCREATGSIGW